MEIGRTHYSVDKHTNRTSAKTVFGKVSFLIARARITFVNAVKVGSLASRHIRNIMNIAGPSNFYANARSNGVLRDLQQVTQFVIRAFLAF